MEDKIITFSQYWRFLQTCSLNRKLSCKSGVGPIKNKADGTFCINDQQKADTLNGYFGSVRVDDDDANPIFLSLSLSSAF